MLHECFRSTLRLTAMTAVILVAAAAWWALRHPLWSLGGIAVQGDVAKATDAQALIDAADALEGLASSAGTPEGATGPSSRLRSSALTSGRVGASRQARLRPSVLAR